MLLRPRVAIVIAAVTCAAAGLADAAVTLQSAQLTSGGGSGVGQTGYGAPVPFPNDASNSARVGPDGLAVTVNRVANAHHHLGNQLVDTWTAEKFAVVFRLDEPEPFTFRRSQVFGDDYLGVITLQAEGQPPVSSLPLFGQANGVLPAGLYTFSGVFDYHGQLPSGPGDVSLTGGLMNVGLTVAPEPAALPLLALAGLCLRRRRAVASAGCG
jgi:MYXO-CTERM domain-containing protein